MDHAQEHLTDLACQEYARHRVTHHAPEGTADVVRHLAECPECARRVVAFERLESDYAIENAGPAAADPRTPYKQRRRKLFLRGAVALTLAALALLAFQG